ncbi:unnamed protein product, partial [Anisakis simplex]|uniref:EB domain-containing protein n=1 Tax=Anisakis simplex TaxID=6269 RepID=A0A0M3J8A4_ANISI
MSIASPCMNGRCDCEATNAVSNMKCFAKNPRETRATFNALNSNDVIAELKNCSETTNSIDDCRNKEDGRTLSPPGGSCYEGQQCTGGSVCRDGWCVCPESSMIVLKGTCILSSSRHVSAAAQPVAELQWITSN